MNMQIGPMLRALLGDSAPADGRALELRIGQIVRGVLLQMLENGDALMNVGGVPVRAKLEAELPVGKGTLLQVQPSSGGGTIVLKPLADTGEAMADESLKHLLKTFGFPEQKWAYELLRGLKRDEYPLGKDTARYFQTAAAIKPASADPAGWMAAAGVAFRRGLPASGETIASLRQALFGPPLHEALADFAQAFNSWMDAEGPVSSRAAEWAGRLRNLLAQGDRLLAQGGALLSGADVAAAEAEQPDGSLPRAAGHPPVPEPSARGEASGNARAAKESGRMNAFLTHDTAEPAPPHAAGNRPAAGVPSGGNAAGSAAFLQGFSIHAGQEEPIGPSVSARSTDAKQETVAANQTASVQENDREGAAPSARRGETNWIGRFLQWLGVDHEHRLLHASSRPAEGDVFGPWPAPHGEEGAAGGARNASDSLKSALLALAASEDAPPALREAAQSLVQQVTGQQLLLASERQANQPYSMMTIFIPMKGGDGDSTAAVHVQARRSRKGEWDSDNCRLWFDLRMRHLGETIVDVQVVNRIVSVKILNDNPGMAKLVEEARGEMEAGLREAGFQLLSITAQPLPSRQAPGDLASAANGDKPSYAGAFKPYKGVDFRI